MTRVGFLLLFADQGWLGGISYFRNLIGALHDLPGRRIEPVVITTPEADPAILANFAPAPVLRTPLVRPGSTLWKARRVLQRVAGRDALLEGFLRRHGIALLSHSGVLGPHSRMPVLPWIPDFQELHLPEFFSAEDRRARARNLEACCRCAPALLLSSEAARADLAGVRPDCAGRARVLPFVADVPDPQGLPTRDELEQRHGFAGDYVHLPNQFWAHKNHALVVEALRRLQGSGLPVQVLATGNPVDHRQPAHYGALMAQVREAGVEARFRSLGLVSYGDLMGLMLHARAVLNPSRFEGWSTTVEEAKSLGRPVLLSDIPVHREQAPPAGRYFDAQDPAALATCLADLFSAPELPAAREALVAAARHSLPQRRRAFAARFEAIALEAIAAGA